MKVFCVFSWSFGIVLGYGWFNGSIFLPQKNIKKTTPQWTGPRWTSTGPEGKSPRPPYLTETEDPAGAGNANMTGVNLDGIHGTAYMAEPWIRHGLCQFISVSIVYPEL